MDIMRLFLLACFLGAFQGCSHTPELLSEGRFRASRQEVWKALVIMFKPYPVKVLDERKGYIETERLYGKNFWTAPHQGKIQTGGLSAVLSVNIHYERPYTKVHVSRRIYRQRSVFSPLEESPSDLFREHVFLYRLGRELLIKKTIDRLKKTQADRAGGFISPKAALRPKEDGSGPWFPSAFGS